ncbi:MAG: hypothetical protein K9M45_06885 [Kiritimatiellales bacterium]|nr:hypothetical protein [Kiritimatiellales bacterium]
MKVKIVVAVAFLLGLAAGLAYRPYEVVVKREAQRHYTRDRRSPPSYRYVDHVVRVNRWTGKEEAPFSFSEQWEKWFPPRNKSARYEILEPEKKPAGGKYADLLTVEKPKSKYADLMEVPAPGTGQPKLIPVDHNPFKENQPPE